MKILFATNHLAYKYKILPKDNTLTKTNRELKVEKNIKCIIFLRNTMYTINYHA